MKRNIHMYTNKLNIIVCSGVTFSRDVKFKWYAKLYKIVIDNGQMATYAFLEMLFLYFPARLHNGLIERNCQALIRSFSLEVRRGVAVEW
jgi:hypothetical protein